MNWFERIAGFPETDYTSTQHRLAFQDDGLLNRQTGQVWSTGALSRSSLSELRAQTQVLIASDESTTLRNTVADARQLHAAETSANATFQVASQFNLLEMVGHMSPLRMVSPATSSTGRRVKPAPLPPVQPPSTETTPSHS